MDRFRKRISSDAWGEEGSPGKDVRDTRDWTLGDDLRKKGSIHSDVWEGTAADLAASGFVAVYPVIGWCRERPNHNCFDKKAQYSLMITLKINENIDIYNSIKTVIENSAGITITT